jgi:hypothetical protein
MCSWLGVGNDPRYTPTSTFETFPFPHPTDVQREAVAAAAAKLDNLRTAWLLPQGDGLVDLRKRTLTNLYNEQPAWLMNAHAALDAAVAGAYGWDLDIAEHDALARLLAHNLKHEPA